MRVSLYGPTHSFNSSEYFRLEEYVAVIMTVVYRHQCDRVFYTQVHADLLGYEAGQYVYQAGKFKRVGSSGLVVEAIHTECSFWQALKMNWSYWTTDLARRDDFASYLILALIKHYPVDLENLNVWIRPYPGATVTGWADEEKWEINEDTATLVWHIAEQFVVHKISLDDAYTEFLSLFEEAGR